MSHGFALVVKANEFSKKNSMRNSAGIYFKYAGGILKLPSELLCKRTEKLSRKLNVNL